MNAKKGRRAGNRRLPFFSSLPMHLLKKACNLPPGAKKGWMHRAVIWTAGLSKPMAASACASTRTFLSAASTVPRTGGL